MEKERETGLLEDFLRSAYDERASDSLKAIRSKAWDRFQLLGLPDQHNEVYRYIKRRELYAANYKSAQTIALTAEQIEPYVLPECAQSCLVFVNGLYQPTLSRRDGIGAAPVILPLKDAIATYGTFLKSSWARTLKEERDPFAAANAAVAEDGLFIYVPARSRVATPVQVLSIVHDATGMMQFPRLLCFVGAQAEFQLYHTAQHLSGRAYAVNQVVDWTLDEAARVEYVSACFDEPEDVWRLEATRAQLKRDSYFRAIAVSKGTATHRHDYNVQLNGENGDARLKGLWQLNGQRQMHSNVLIHHAAPHCSSMQLFKGVGYDATKSSFEGKIYVEPEAQLTDAFQLNNNLLLGEGAQAYSKPNLEIFADDVKASHGATIGQLDEDELFYLRTRGIAMDQARRMLVQGFVEEVIEKIPLDSLRQRILEWMCRG